MLLEISKGVIECGFEKQVVINTSFTYRKNKMHENVESDKRHNDFIHPFGQFGLLRRREEDCHNW